MAMQQKEIIEKYAEYTIEEDSILTSIVQKTKDKIASEIELKEEIKKELRDEIRKELVEELEYKVNEIKNLIPEPEGAYNIGECPSPSYRAELSPSYRREPSSAYSRFTMTNTGY